MFSVKRPNRTRVGDIKYLNGIFERNLSHCNNCQSIDYEYAKKLNGKTVTLFPELKNKVIFEQPFRNRRNVRCPNTNLEEERKL